MKVDAWPRCPYLGLTDDPALYCIFANEAHRCYREGKGAAIPWDKQELLCLTDGHEACMANWAAAPKPIGRLRPAPRVVALAGMLLASAMLLAWARGYLAVAPTDALPASQSAAAQSEPTEPPPTAIPVALLAAVAFPTATPPPTATPRPTATAERLPTPAPATPTARPAAPRVHIVAPGETLWDISSRYGTSIDAIMHANGLADRNFIWYGQRLVIP